MTTYSLKRRFQDVLRPTAYSLDRFGLTPNQITFGTCLLSIAFAAFLVYWQKVYWVFFLFPFFFVLRMALNAIDGMIAKERGKITKVGALLNEMCDVVSDAALMSVFFFVTSANSHLVWSFIYLSLFVECAAHWSATFRGERSYCGPMGKSDRGIVLSLLAFIVGFSGYHQIPLTHLVEAVLIVANLLLLMTLANRIRFALADGPR